MPTNCPATENGHQARRDDEVQGAVTKRRSLRSCGDPRARLQSATPQRATVHITSLTARPEVTEPRAQRQPSTLARRQVALRLLSRSCPGVDGYAPSSTPKLHRSRAPSCERAAMATTSPKPAMGGRLSDCDGSYSIDRQTKSLVFGAGWSCRPCRSASSSRVSRSDCPNAYAYARRAPERAAATCSSGSLRVRATPDAKRQQHVRARRL